MIVCTQFCGDSFNTCEDISCKNNQDLFVVPIHQYAALFTMLVIKQKEIDWRFNRRERCELWDKEVRKLEVKSTSEKVGFEDFFKGWQSFGLSDVAGEGAPEGSLELSPEGLE